MQHIKFEHLIFGSNLKIYLHMHMYVYHDVRGSQCANFFFIKTNFREHWKFFEQFCGEDFLHLLPSFFIIFYKTTVP